MDNSFFLDRWDDDRYDSEDEAQDAENERATDAYISAQNYDDENFNT